MFRTNSKHHSFAGALWRSGAMACARGTAQSRANARPACRCLFGLDSGLVVQTGLEIRPAFQTEGVASTA